MNRVDATILFAKEKARRGCKKCIEVLTRKHAGADKLVVAAALCIVGLLLATVFQTGMETFINTIVGKLVTKAEGMLGL